MRFSVVLICLLVVASGCGPSEREVATEKLLSVKYSDRMADYIRELISEGADVNAENGFGRTPLYQACMFGHLEVATLLIEEGADVNAKTKDGMTPLSVATNHTIIKLLKARGALGDY